ncbi:ethanolamine utilization protein eutP [Desulforamulus reducens MI-1]|uniref:Ethanolamine utilization protein eutP n=1 Tax=Desulforamulus reducens (strain ATCC BAA-1160 / DSM 100696 / MI-1) TaxID=349161 RepID=A4J422_DESRM|nr:EutP/PduV family microcompartment system protein [Desulforamulus reducens]ABO49825.1 ethanolamine utilization protein eutP [Desulforamulus reducens MI-1]
MSKIMVVGAVGAGKSTILAALRGNVKDVKKTQVIEFGAQTVDTPGEYIENPRFYRALLSTALQVDYVLFVQDATSDRSVFPPGIGQLFPGYSVGIITKVDHPEANVERAKGLLHHLALKGKGEVFEVSALAGDGLEELKQRLEL